VFWHTQGSGKSYSMVFLTEKIHRKVSGRYTFVVITDRSELDDQIASTYTNTGRANSKTDQAASGDALRRMLRDQNRRYVFGLIQKYRERVQEAYSTATTSSSSATRRTAASTAAWRSTCARACRAPSFWASPARP
jgi:type I restriction enzyme R subunit